MVVFDIIYIYMVNEIKVAASSREKKDCKNNIML